MKTKLFYKFLTFLLVLTISGCAKRNYFPDPDDPGLSRFTSYGFDIGTFYLNDTPYINSFLGSTRGNSIPTLTKIVTSSAFDTLMLSWDIGINDNGNADFNSPYQTISLLMPIPKSFTKADFIAMSGQRFIYNVTSLQTPYYYNDNDLSILPNIYFVKINPIQFNGSTTTSLELSGLFNCKIYIPRFIGDSLITVISDSLIITKGRFDFKIDESSLNF